MVRAPSDLLAGRSARELCCPALPRTSSNMNRLTIDDGYGLHEPASQFDRPLLGSGSSRISRTRCNHVAVDTADHARRLRRIARAALSATASSTGWISVGELAMTPKISLVAVCCSNDSVEFLEQPHVLDGDHGLVGEGFEQLDLRRGEGRTIGPANADHA